MGELAFGDLVLTTPRSLGFELRDQFFSQPSDHTLSPAVQFWRYPLGEGRNLRDAHCSFRRPSSVLAFA
jgi:hypothetical protein